MCTCNGLHNWLGFAKSSLDCKLGDVENGLGAHGVRCALGGVESGLGAHGVRCALGGAKSRLGGVESGLGAHGVRYALSGLDHAQNNRDKRPTGVQCLYPRLPDNVFNSCIRENNGQSSHRCRCVHTPPQTTTDRSKTV